MDHWVRLALKPNIRDMRPQEASPITTEGYRPRVERLR